MAFIFRKCEIVQGGLNPHNNPAHQTTHATPPFLFTSYLFLMSSACVVDLLKTYFLPYYWNQISVKRNEVGRIARWTFMMLLVQVNENTSEMRVLHGTTLVIERRPKEIVDDGVITTKVSVFSHVIFIDIYYYQLCITWEILWTVCGWWHEWESD